MKFKKIFKFAGYLVPRIFAMVIGGGLIVIGCIPPFFPELTIFFATPGIGLITWGLTGLGLKNKKRR
jgi:hypothetical protein